MTVFKHQM